MFTGLLAASSISIGWSVILPMNAVMRESLQEDKVVVDPVGARVLPDKDATSREATAERWVRPILGVCLRLAWGANGKALRLGRLPVVQVVRLQVSLPTWMRSKTRTGWRLKTRARHG